MRKSTLLTVPTLLLSLSFASWANARPWSFGVMSDTQWKANLDGENPETVAVGIINQLNANNVLSLWGMCDLGSDQTDTYGLAIGYDKKPGNLKCGEVGIATRDMDGNWTNAVDLNFGGTKNFVVGPWKETYGLGTYGVDPSSKTVWAVINYEGDFAVASDMEPLSGHCKGRHHRR